MANLQNALPLKTAADRARRRKALVARSKTRHITSAARRRAHGYQEPTAAKLAYTSAMRKLVKRMWDVVMIDYADVIKAHAVREDDLRKTHVIGDVRVQLYKLVADVAPGVVGKVAAQVDAHNIRESKRVLGIDPRLDPGTTGVLDAFRSENVRLIRSIADQQLEEVEGVLRENFGLRIEELSSLLQERFGVTESRGDLIARDQTLKLNGQLTQTRQVAAGINEYIWTTSRDERVRPEHEERDGQTFRWDVPPEDGQPGEPICCRCTAFPLISGLDEEG